MSIKLYLIPGTMCSEKLWLKVRPFLNKNVELVHLNIPVNKSFDELAEYYAGVFDSSPAVNLLGFSLGGYIASHFSALYPEQVAKLFVVSNSPTVLSTQELNQRKQALRYAELHGYKGVSRKKIAALLDAKQENEELIDLILEMNHELGEQDFVSQNRYLSQRKDLASAIAQFPFDTRFYFSEGDKLVNVKWLESLQAANSNISLMPTVGSGHMLPLEKPHEFASFVHAWLGL